MQDVVPRLVNALAALEPLLLLKVRADIDYLLSSERFSGYLSWPSRL
jgi:hypothetical protein